MNTSYFPWINRYLGIQLDTEIPSLQPGETRVVESPRRLRCEQSYGYIHALFGVWFVDGRAAISVPPGAMQGVLQALQGSTKPQPPFEKAFIERLVEVTNRALEVTGLPAVRNVYHGKTYACNAALVRPWQDGDCRRLQDESLPPAAGLQLPAHCFPDGIVYGVVADGQVVSYAHTHRSGILEDRVADIGVETAEAYRRRGYARTVVSAVTAHLTANGGEGLYNCSAGNLASMATARSAGYDHYGDTLILALVPASRSSAAPTHPAFYP